MRSGIQPRKVRIILLASVHNVTKLHGTRVLLDGVSFQVSSGQKIALIGPNGCGKTTLLRDVVELNAWDSPVIRIGPSLRVAYCAQGQEVPRDEETIIDEVMRIGPTPRKRAGRGKASADLERRIAEVEQQKLDLERRMTEALANRNHREGRRAGKQLQQITAQLDNLYKKWIAESQ